MRVNRGEGCEVLLAASIMIDAIEFDDGLWDSW